MMRITTDTDYSAKDSHAHLKTRRQPDDRRPLKVLHAVGRMNCGGIETWLMHLLRTVDRQQHAMDFLVHSPEPGFYDEEILDSGARIIVAGSQFKLTTLTRNLNRTLTQFGPYDVFHSHVGHFSGYLLPVSRIHGIPTRIAHSHNDWALAEKKASMPRRVYLRTMASQIRLHATHGIAPSPQAARTLFGAGWQRDPRFQVMHYGLDFKPFEVPIQRDKIRSQFGFTPENHVFIHVGSFSEQKNHTFLLDVMKTIARRLPQSRLLLLGDGPLRNEIEQKIENLGLSRVVTLAGVRSDVPRLLRAADAFIFPSHFEGLGLALVEAQAAGLPCIISNTIPTDANLVPELVHALDLRKNTRHQWVNACVHTVVRKPADPQQAQIKALQTVCASDFNITNCAHTLFKLYTSG